MGILQQKDSAFKMRSAKEQDIISNLKHCINAMTSYQFRVIVGLSISSHCWPNNFESMYQFWVIVSILSYCINFESLYQFRVIVSNSNCINAMTWHVFGSLYQFRVIVGLSILKHSTNFKTLYLFRDFVFISRQRSETSYSFQECAYISVFPSH